MSIPKPLYLWDSQEGGEEEKIREDGGEDEKKSLTGDTGKALITAYFLSLSEKNKICGEEKLVLQEHSLLMTYLLFKAACAAARRAIGTRKGEQDT